MKAQNVTIKNSYSTLVCWWLVLFLLKQNMSCAYDENTRPFRQGMAKGDKAVYNVLDEDFEETRYLQRRKLYKHSSYAKKYGESLKPAKSPKSAKKSPKNSNGDDSRVPCDGEGKPNNNSGKGKGSSSTSSSSSADGSSGGTECESPCPPQVQNCVVDLGKVLDMLEYPNIITFEAFNLPLAANETSVALETYMYGDLGSNLETAWLLIGPEQNPLLDENGDQVIWANDEAIDCRSSVPPGEWYNITFAAEEFNLWQGNITFSVQTSPQVGQCPEDPAEVQMQIRFDLLQRCEVCP